MKAIKLINLFKDVPSILEQPLMKKWIADGKVVKVYNTWYMDLSLVQGLLKYSDSDIEEV